LSARLLGLVGKPGTSTPALVIDLDAMKRNLGWPTPPKHQVRAGPHAKLHKAAAGQDTNQRPAQLAYVQKNHRGRNHGGRAAFRNDGALSNRASLEKLARVAALTQASRPWRPDRDCGGAAPKA
jgi:hypothetical protein